MGKKVLLLTVHISCLNFCCVFMYPLEENVCMQFQGFATQLRSIHDIPKGLQNAREDWVASPAAQGVKARPREAPAPIRAVCCEPHCH